MCAINEAPSRYAVLVFSKGNLAAPTDTIQRGVLVDRRIAHCKNTN